MQQAKISLPKISSVLPIFIHSLQATTKRFVQFSYFKQPQNNFLSNVFGNH